MALATSEIRLRSGMKGKAVHIIHVYKDYLWAMGEKSDPPDTHGALNDEVGEEDEDEDGEGDKVDEKDKEHEEMEHENQANIVEESTEPMTPVKKSLNTDGKLNAA